MGTAFSLSFESAYRSSRCDECDAYAFSANGKRTSVRVPRMEFRQHAQPTSTSNVSARVRGGGVAGIRPGMCDTRGNVSCAGREW